MYSNCELRVTFRGYYWHPLVAVQNCRT